LVDFEIEVCDTGTKPDRKIFDFGMLDQLKKEVEKKDVIIKEISAT